MAQPYRIGLTGNIAMGKSTVARLLQELGAEVIDADGLVHELYRPGNPLVGWIAEAFGSAILAADGGIDRRRLGEIVFSDPVKLRKLEAIVHPAVARLCEQRIAKSAGPVVVIEAVKLMEADQHRQCDALWVVICDPNVQLQRLKHQRGLSSQEAQARLRVQPPLEAKLRIADVVLTNNGSLDDLRRQVVEAWERTVAPALSAEGKRLVRSNTGLSNDPERRATL